MVELEGAAPVVSTFTIGNQRIVNGHCFIRTASHGQLFQKHVGAELAGI
jgi:hypothetical protein